MLNANTIYYLDTEYYDQIIYFQCNSAFSYTAILPFTLFGLASACVQATLSVFKVDILFDVPVGLFLNVEKNIDSRIETLKVSTSYLVPDCVLK